MTSSTVADNPQPKSGDQTSPQFQLDVRESGAPEATDTLGTIEQPESSTSLALSSLPDSRKRILLFCFCLSMFIDSAGASAILIMTAPIAQELDIDFANEAWILGTYTMVFASTLLFAGRIADLYPPHRVYTIGFLGIAVSYLVISFLTDRYSFFVLRALSAIPAVMTIPSSIRMLVSMYPDTRVQAKKLAVFGMASALANTIAFIIAGVFLLASFCWRRGAGTFDSFPSWLSHSPLHRSTSYQTLGLTSKGYPGWKRSNVWISAAWRCLLRH